MEMFLSQLLIIILFGGHILQCSGLLLDLNSGSLQVKLLGSNPDWQVQGKHFNHSTNQEYILTKSIF